MVLLHDNVYSRRGKNRDAYISLSDQQVYLLRSGLTLSSHIIHYISLFVLHYCVPWSRPSPLAKPHALVIFSSYVFDALRLISELL